LVLVTRHTLEPEEGRILYLVRLRQLAVVQVVVTLAATCSCLDKVVVPEVAVEILSMVVAVLAYV
jgi:hypothetical protein